MVTAGVILDIYIPKALILVFINITNISFYC